MVFSLKKYYVYIVALIMILGCCGISSFVLGGDFMHADDNTDSFTVVVDAGHGGLDGGAVSKDGVSEKNINLNIALKLKEKLELAGVKVILTRDKDVSLHENENTSVKEKKRSDLLKRKEIADKSGADFLISIHLNSFSETQYKGAQVFYEVNHTQSKFLAECLQSSFKETLDGNNTRVAKAIDSKKLLFTDLKIPGVIAECGFLSNEEETKLLVTDEYQEKIAEALYRGITYYFGKENI